MRLTEYLLQLLAGHWLAAVINVKLTTDRFEGHCLFRLIGNICSTVVSLIGCFN